MSPINRKCRERGSTMLEFVFVLPIGVALLVGALSVGTTSLRAIQAGQLAKDALLMVDSGVDFGAAGGQQQLVERGRELGLEKGQSAVFITRIVREATGSRIDRKFEMGSTSRWHSGLNNIDDVAELEAGESAWVVEVFTESGSLTSMLPETVKARSLL